MSRTLAGSVLTICCLAVGVIAAAQPGGRRPPPAAYEACEGKNEGDRCSVNTPRGTLEGTCTFLSEDDGLVCFPDDFGANRPQR